MSEIYLEWIMSQQKVDTKFRMVPSELTWYSEIQT